MNADRTIIFYYRLGFGITALAFLGMLAFHLYLWPIWGLAPAKVDENLWMAVPLFMMLWMVGALKQTQHRNLWKGVDLGIGKGMRTVTGVLSLYTSLLFFGMFFSPFITVPAALQKYLSTKMIFMLGWTAGVMFMSFMVAKDTWYQIRYMKNHGKPSPNLSNWAASLPVQLKKPEIIVPFQTKSVPGSSKDEMEVTALPVYKSLASGYLLAFLGFLFVLFQLWRQPMHHFSGAPSWFGVFQVVFQYLVLALGLIIPMGIILTPIRTAYFSRVAAILSPRGFWSVGLGWVDWTEIDCLLVWGRLERPSLWIIPKDWSLAHRVPWNYKVPAYLYLLLVSFARLIAGRPTQTYKIGTYPWTGLSVSGPEFIEYAKKYGVESKNYWEEKKKTNHS